MTSKPKLTRQETTAQTTTCQACDRASNINSPYLWCSRDKSHYPHNREACKAFVDRAIPMIDHDIHLKPGRVVV
jgi:hypothetical protein